MNYINNKPQTLHEKLSGEDISFSKKLKTLVREGELDYWWSRGNPPNESQEVFKKFIKKLKGEINPRWEQRKSQNGQNALLGEERCFLFEHEISLFGEKKKFFVKGYFFNEGDLKGVTIQSFREIKLQLVLS